MTVVHPNHIVGINSITVLTGDSLSIHKNDGSLIRTIVSNTGVSTFHAIEVSKGGGDLNVGVSTFFVDNSAGRIGVGTDVPASLLDVVNTGGAAEIICKSSTQPRLILKTTGTTSECRVDFGDSGDSSRGAIGYNHSDDALKFYTTGVSNERLRIDDSGRLLIGTATARANFNAGDGSHIQLEGTTQNTSTISAVRNSNNDGPAHLVLAKTRNGSVGGNTVVQSGDSIGSLNFEANDGTNLIRAAEVLSQVDGTPGTNDMPGRLIFKTTADGAASASERLRIDSNGMSKFTRGSGGTVAHFYANARECNILLQNDARTWKIVNYDYTDAGADNLGFHDGTADRFIIKNNGNVQIPDGDLEVASGHGIDFSAVSHAGGMTSELLDSYEEGTFTPYIRGAGGSAGSYAQFGLNGKYTKIGNMVHFTMQSVLSNKGSYSGNFKWGGLPFTAAASNYAVAINMYPSTNVDGVMRTARVNNGQDFGYVMSGSRLDIPAPYSEIVTGYYFSVAGTYQAA